MLTDYKNTNSLEETQVDQSNAAVSASEQTTQDAYEEQSDNTEESFFWFEPGLCG